MRHLFRYIFAASLGCILLFALACNRTTTGGGDGRSRVQIKNVQVGMKPGPMPGNDDPLRRYPLYKAGLWTPVLVEIEGKGKLDEAELVVETTDASDVLPQRSRRNTRPDDSQGSGTLVFCPKPKRRI